MLPGDPVAALAGERDMSPERHAEMMEKLGLDKPAWQQYLDYVWNLLHGDFGTSVLTNRPILDEFMELFPATVELRASWASRWWAIRCRYSGGGCC